MSQNYKSIEMTQPPHGLDSMAIGFLGGCVSLLNTMPKPIFSSIGGAFVVAVLLSFFSYIGKALGVIVWRHTVNKYRKFKNKTK